MIILKTTLKSKSYENASLDDLLSLRNYSLTIRFPQGSQQSERLINCHPTFDIYNLQEIKICMLEKSIFDFPENIRKLYSQWKVNQQRVKKYVFRIFYAMNKKYNPSEKEKSLNDNTYRIFIHSYLHILVIECLDLMENLYNINLNLISKILSLILFEHKKTFPTDLIKISDDLDRIIKMQEKFLKISEQCVKVLESEYPLYC